MGLFDALMGRKPTAPAPSALTFTLADAGYTYDDGNVGLEPTSLTITERRVAVIGLNGSGKTTLLKMLDGALTATSGTVSITGGEESLDPAVKRDLKRIEDIIGRVRREEIPNSYYKAATIAEAIDEPLKKHKVPESERQAIIGNLFAHFGLAEVSRQPASALDSEKRHLLAIASALSFSPAAIVADEPTKGLDEIGTAHVARALFGYNKQVVFATHDTEMIVRPEYAIDRTLVLDDHRIVFDGVPADAVASTTIWSEPGSRPPRRSGNRTGIPAGPCRRMGYAIISATVSSTARMLRANSSGSGSSETARYPFEAISKKYPGWPVSRWSAISRSTSSFSSMTDGTRSSTFQPPSGRSSEVTPSGSSASRRRSVLRLPSTRPRTRMVCAGAASSNPAIRPAMISLIGR